MSVINDQEKVVAEVIVQPNTPDRWQYITSRTNVILVLFLLFDHISIFGATKMKVMKLNTKITN